MRMTHHWQRWILVGLVTKLFVSPTGTAFTILPTSRVASSSSSSRPRRQKPGHHAQQRGRRNNISRTKCYMSMDVHGMASFIWSSLIHSPVGITETHGSMSGEQMFDSFLSTLYTASAKVTMTPQDILDAAGTPVPPSPSSFQDIPDALKEALEKQGSNGPLFDPRTITRTSYGPPPGFEQTRSFLPSSPDFSDMELDDEFIKAQLRDSIGLMKTMTQAPKAAFVAVAVDFFLISPGIDLYKEEIDEDPSGVALDVLKEASVRGLVMLAVAGLTFKLFFE